MPFIKRTKNISKYSVLGATAPSRNCEVNAIKMVSLPWNLLLDSIVLPFVWGYKSHRISKGHLQKASKKGSFLLEVSKLKRTLCCYSWKLIPFCPRAKFTETSIKNSLKILNWIMMACRVSLHTCSHKLKSFIFAFQLPLILLGKIEPKIWASKPRQSLGSRRSQAKSYFLIGVPCVWRHIAEGSIKHLFWFCPKMHNFWSAVVEQLPESFSLTVTQPILDALPRLPAFRRPLCTSGCWWLRHLFLKPESLPVHPLMLTSSITQMERRRLHTPNVRQNPGTLRVPVTGVMPDSTFYMGFVSL